LDKNGSREIRWETLSGADNGSLDWNDSRGGNTKGLRIYSGSIKKISLARCWWLTPVILATWEAEIRRTTFQGQLGVVWGNSSRDPILKKPNTK
jgi:hypothetical protein